MTEGTESTNEHISTCTDKCMMNYKTGTAEDGN